MAPEAHRGETPSLPCGGLRGLPNHLAFKPRHKRDHKEWESTVVSSGGWGHRGLLGFLFWKELKADLLLAPHSLRTVAGTLWPVGPNLAYHLFL